MQMNKFFNEICESKGEDMGHENMREWVGQVGGVMEFEIKERDISIEGVIV